MSAPALPQYVQENLQKRALAHRMRGCGAAADDTTLTCRTYPARLYPCGWRCTDHAPPAPPTPDPAATLDALRARAAEEALDRLIAARETAAPTPTSPIRTETLTERFQAFHARNPHVMQRLEQLVTAHVDAGSRRIGIGQLFEELRHSDLETNGNRYRLDNSLRADYVRALIAEHPDWAGLFELRERRAA